jgi:hypothetical protein
MSKYTIIVKNWIKRLARLNLPVYQFESDSMKIVYAGYSSVKKNYYARLFLKSNNHQKVLRRRWFWEMPAFIKYSKCDMVIAETSPTTFNYFQKCKGYILPEWVRMTINIDRPMSEIVKRSVSDFSDVMRKIRKYNLTYEILNDKESHNCFIDKFYLPYITKRHGEEAWIEDLNIMWKASPSPFLIAIREDQKTVGMSIVRNEGNVFSLLRLGLLDGNDEYRRHGVIGAIYYFSIVEGQKVGCQYLDVGGTRPFLTDGLTKFKMGLSAEFVKDINPKTEVYLWLGVNEHSFGANEFIQSNPFICVDKHYRLVSIYAK